MAIACMALFFVVGCGEKVFYLGEVATPMRAACNCCGNGNWMGLRWAA